MTNLLLRLFVPDYENREDTAVRAAVGSLSGTVGILCNLLLFAVKLAAGLMTGALSITADAMNNLSDASASIVTLAGFRLAGKPADAHHPYGHARFEYLSGLAVAALILFIGFELAKSSLEKIFTPTPVAFSFVAVAILLLSMGLKLWMCLFNRKLGKEIQSQALMATAADSRNDCIATGAVLLAAVLGAVTKLHLDGWMGMAVAGFILYSGIQLAKDTINPLLGESADPELRQKIVDYIQRQPKVLGYHDLMVHDYGPGQRFASLHVEMDRNEDPLLCHEIIDDMERECLRSHNVHLVIHYDPVITDDPELNRMRQLVSALLRVKDHRLTLHDFRMSQGETRTELSFDVDLPGDLQGQEETIRTTLETALNDLGEGEYGIAITFDPAVFEGR
ncbi:MAG: cation diffusion facilitator family transporter [Oscillospiraceae bacterium]|nr:cation diffusion facilitator family transporter [Oscillospiraceae bacterium]